MIPLTPTAVSTEKRRNPQFTWFYDVLSDFIIELYRHPAPAVILADPGIAQEPGAQPCNLADLDFSFFISKGGGFRNGLWASVPARYGNNSFLRIGISPKLKMNVNVFSAAKINCPGISMKQCSFALPPQFSPFGCWKTSSRVHSCEPSDILKDISGLITCLHETEIN